MSDHSIVLENIELAFPRHRVGLKSVLRWVQRRMGKDATIDPFVALKNVNIKVKKGEILGIIGGDKGDCCAVPLLLATPACSDIMA